MVYVYVKVYVYAYAYAGLYDEWVCRCLIFLVLKESSLLSRE